jgi:hypothetical protein
VQYELLVADLERRSVDHTGGPPHVLGLRPPAGTPCIGQLECKPQILASGAADGERLVEAALSSESRIAAR